ncbi:MAG: flagellar biosynthesis protein FlhF [Bdellovibrionota bacterium]
MQVKKFEAPTIQEALENVKRELGPEAIILQTKQNRGGFGLLSKPSVEVTAAVSERSLIKKKKVESKLPNVKRSLLNKLPAYKQANMYDKYEDKYLEHISSTREHVEVSAAAKTAVVEEKIEDIASPAAAKHVTSRRYIDIDDDEPATVKSAVSQKVNATASIEEEVKRLRKLVEELSAVPQVQTTVVGNPVLQEAFEQLLVSGLDRKFAFPLVRKAANEIGTERSGKLDAVLDQVALEIMMNTEVISPLRGVNANDNKPRGPVIMAVVGPTGVGKTTSVAKIAAEAKAKRNLKAGFLNLDVQKPTSFNQLATYAKILNIPFRSAATTEDLKAVLQDFKSLDLVIVDTAGFSQRNPESLKDTQTLLSELPNLQTHLVLSATTRDSELYDMSSRFSVLRPQGLIITKLDESTTYGSIYNISQKAKLPLLYFTTGQRVPEDIEDASRERVAALILDIH